MKIVLTAARRADAIGNGRGAGLHRLELGATCAQGSSRYGRSEADFHACDSDSLIRPSS